MSQWSQDDLQGLTFICFVGCMGVLAVAKLNKVPWMMHAIHDQCHTVSSFRFKGREWNVHQFSDVEDGHPIARSSSPEQQVDNSRATTAGAVSRSTREGTTNCVMTASLRAFDGGLCDGMGPSCDGLVINLLGFLITLLDAAQTWCSWLFLFSLCSWSSQGQTWMCPCFFENQYGRFPGNLMLSNYYICWIGAGFIAWKGLLERIFSWSRIAKTWEAESRGERKLWVQRNQAVRK